MSRASVFAYSRFIADPRMAPLRGPLRARLAREYVAYGGACLDAGDIAGGRRALARAFTMRPGVRTGTAFAASSVAPRAGRRVVRVARSRLSA